MNISPTGAFLRFLLAFFFLVAPFLAVPFFFAPPFFFFAIQPSSLLVS